MEHLQNRKHDFSRLSVEYKHWYSFHFIFPMFAEHWLLHLLYYKLANNRKLYLPHVLLFYPQLSLLVTTFAFIIGKTWYFPYTVLEPNLPVHVAWKLISTRQEPAYLLSDFTKLPGRVNSSFSNTHKALTLYTADYLLFPRILYSVMKPTFLPSCKFLNTSVF